MTFSQLPLSTWSQGQVLPWSKALHHQDVRSLSISSIHSSTVLAPIPLFLLFYLSNLPVRLAGVTLVKVGSAYFADLPHSVQLYHKHNIVQYFMSITCFVVIYGQEGRDFCYSFLLLVSVPERHSLNMHWRLDEWMNESVVFPRTYYAQGIISLNPMVVSIQANPKQINLSTVWYISYLLVVWFNCMTYDY